MYLYFLDRNLSLMSANIAVLWVGWYRDDPNQSVSSIS